MAPSPLTDATNTAATDTAVAAGTATGVAVTDTNLRELA